MPQIVYKQRGNFNNLIRYLSGKNRRRDDILKRLEYYGRVGVAALQSATPVDTGTTAYSWDYAIEEGSKGFTISWTNSNVNEGYNIALLIQYGHGLKNGGYIAGRDYINPAILPVFEAMINDIGDEVSKL